MNKTADSPLQNRDLIFWGIIVICVISAGLFYLYLFSKGLYAISADENGRTLEAFRWSFTKIMRPRVWLPFYRVVIDSALRIWPDLFLTPRIITMIFGVFSYSSLCWLSYELFRSREVTVITAVLAIVFPQLAILSVVPLSEIMFFFMIIMGCAFLMRWVHSNNRASLFYSCLFFSLGNTVRYEAWIFSGCFIIFLFVDLFIRKNRVQFKDFIISVSILLIFPVCWVILFGLQTGNPIGFIGSTVGSYMSDSSGADKLLLKRSVFWQFVKQNCKSLNIFGLIALIYLIVISKGIRKWIVVPAAAFIIMSVMSIVGKTLPSHNYWRIPAAWSILLVPFTAYWIFGQKDFFTKLKIGWRYVFICLVALIFFVQFFVQTNKLRRINAFSQNELLAGRYIREELSKSTDLSNCKVMIGQNDWDFSNIVIASNYPGSFVYDKGGYGPSGKAFVNPEVELDLKDLRLMGVKYLVFEEKNKKVFLDSNPYLLRIQDFGGWAVYMLLDKKMQKMLIPLAQGANNEVNYYEGYDILYPKDYNKTCKTIIAVKRPDRNIERAYLHVYAYVVYRKNFVKVNFPNGKSALIKGRNEEKSEIGSADLTELLKENENVEVIIEMFTNKKTSTQLYDSRIEKMVLFYN